MTKRVKQNLMLMTGLIGCVIFLSTNALPQSETLRPKRVNYTLSFSSVRATLPPSKEITGDCSYFLTQALIGDVTIGVITFSLSEPARQTLAELTGFPLAQVPTNLRQENVAAEVLGGNGFPTTLRLRPLTLEVLGYALTLTEAETQIQGREAPSENYSTEELEALFTHWAIQINTARPRRGIIRRINMVIRGEV